MFMEYRVFGLDRQHCVHLRLLEQSFVHAADKLVRSLPQFLEIGFREPQQLGFVGDDDRKAERVAALSVVQLWSTDEATWFTDRTDRVVVRLFQAVAADHNFTVQQQIDRLHVILRGDIENTVTGDRYELWTLIYNRSNQVIGQSFHQGEDHQILRQKLFLLLFRQVCAQDPLKICGDSRTVILVRVVQLHDIVEFSHD